MISEIFRETRTIILFGLLSVLIVLGNTLLSKELGDGCERHSVTIRVTKLHPEIFGPMFLKSLNHDLEQKAQYRPT
jgi:hypothetical protein